MTNRTRPDLSFFTNPKKEITITVNSDDADEIVKIQKLHKRRSDLIQIAEMYFDSMLGTPAEKSICFEIVSKTLNDLG